MKFLIASLFAFFFSSLCWAQSERVTSSIHHQTLSARAMGMGGAIMATADDFNTLAFNPAGLAFLETWQMRGTIALAADNDVKTLFEDIDNAQSESGDANQEEAIIAAIEKQFGKQPHLRVTPLFGAWVWKGMGFSWTPADLSTDIAIDQQIGPSLTVSSTADSTFRFGYAREVKAGKSRLAWGVTAKAIYRAFYQDSFAAAQLLDEAPIFEEDDVDEGFTVDADIGLIWAPHIPSQGFFSFFEYAVPTFGLVVRNAADYGFTSNFNLLTENSGEPPKLGRVVDVGSEYALPKLWVFHPRFVFDVRDIGDDNWTFLKGYHAGFELEWVVGNWLKGAYRIGLNQGYWTAGISAKAAVFQLDLATWGEEVGASGNRKESRRYMLTLNMDL
jgi:hypothetical protein